ncbi:MAG: homoserine dehydrogenase [Micavibrio aeruginosavorus]|uniref:Homoserine dehydrogenase n=1 Tax=Micavibrio aeruginosavorus TaxID=349221 RepID=A0A2W4ZZ87_9BACT|nr:MAG: homoserine dehydrogenase [Micavibrio aeruginosavorus]
MKAPLRIGIAGLGTVGVGVIRMLQAHGNDIARCAGRSIEIAGINARDKARDRGVDLSRYTWFENPVDTASDKDIDVVVELIGGDEGVARELVFTALQNKKHVVTANKALLAKHGLELARIAEANDVSLNFEASAAGGIPIIKALREGFAGNRIDALYGILNGTCNYILTEMRLTGRDFSDVLYEAQEKGYAEADPTFDVDGIDAAHKLSILSSLAFGIKPSFDKIDVDGIRRISANDIAFAGELGCRIKLLGIARRTGAKIALSMEPCLVSQDSAIGSVEGVFNAVFVEGDFVDRAMLEGRGAGQGPTASAVLSDLIDLARDYRLPAFGVPVDALSDAVIAGAGEVECRHYMHLSVRDEPGVIADVSAVLRDHNISIETMLQRGRDPGQAVSVVITTHDCSRKAMREAAEMIRKIGSVMADPTILRIQEF